jgi:penicillin-binding protein 1A
MSPDRGRRGARRAARILVIMLVSVLFVPLGAAGTVLAALIFLPLPAELPPPPALSLSLPTQVLDIDGNPIGQFRRFETSVPFRKADIPLVLKQAVISAEDKNFYKHGGVDPRGILRAFWADYRNRAAVQGGSTITQQYVKRAYTGGERTIARKLREAILASQLDRQVDKEEILYRYLSTIFLGNGAYGVEAASELYFRKPVSQLTLSEAAMIAGLIPAPSRYEPLGNPDLAESKRRLVLQTMHDEGYITFEQLSAAFGEGLWFADSGPAPGPATLLYKPVTQRTQYPYWMDYVQRYLEPTLGESLFTGGLRVQTTLDVEIQAAAEEAVSNTLDGTAYPLEMSLVAVEPPTGYVRALVGGRDFYGPRGQVNLALGKCPDKPADPEAVVEVEASCWTDRSVEGGGSGRQSGSAWKPFTLAAALSQGISPTKVYRAPSEYLPRACQGRVSAACKPIGNAEGGGGGSRTLRDATVHSVNTVYAQLQEDLGLKATGDMARKLGITSAWASPRIHGLSYTLGVLDVSPLDMASAYGVFAARGVRAKASPVVRVVDKEGRVVFDDSTPETERVLNENVADNINNILRGVITSGTGTAANIGRPAAGKTGTGQNYTNAWFVGYTPTLSTAVWMGYADSQSKPLTGIKGVGRVFGGTWPARTWKAFMSKALEDVPVTEFTDPAPIKSVADALRVAARGGFDFGPKRSRARTPADCDGPCGVTPAPPEVFAPTTTTSTTRPISPTTTRRGRDDDDDDDGGGGRDGDGGVVIPAPP